MSSQLKILYYTRFFKQTLKEAVGFSPGVAEDLCEVIHDRDLLADADVVLFHIPNVKEPLPGVKRPGQLWVSMSMESDVYYPLQCDPNFMGLFDLKMNLRKDADVSMFYFNPERVSDLQTVPKWKYRRSPAVYFASNSKSRNNRQELVLELMQHMRIDSYGKSQRNRRILWDNGRATKLRIISRYLFYLAFENSNSVDYVSEKVFDGLIAGTVPVYLGAPNVEEYLPANKCIIKASDFKNAADLSKYLLALQKDQKEYESYLAWKEEPLRKSFLDLIEREKTPHLRRLCYKIMELRKNKAIKR